MRTVYAQYWEDMMAFQDSEVYQNFKEWVMRFSERPFDLNGSKEKVAEEFYERFLAGYYKSIKEFSKSVLKSYVLTKEEEIIDFVKPEDLIIKKPVDLINKFLNEYIVDHGKVDCQNTNDVSSVVSKLIFEEAEKVFGDVIYLDMLNPKFKTIPEIKRGVVEAYKKEGFLPYSKDVRFLIRKEKTAEINDGAKHQAALLKIYNYIFDSYIKNYQAHIHRDFSEDQYNEFWTVVKLCLDNIESRLTEESKKNEKFVETKHLVDTFFESTKERVRRTFTKEGRYGDYYNVIKNSLKNYLGGSYDNQDVQNLQQFYERIELVNEALKVTDDKNQNYPANYFVYMPIHPATILDLLSRFQKSDFLSEKQKLVVGDTKRWIRATFPNPYLSNTGDVAKVRDVLLPFKNKTQFSDGTVRDLTSDEKYNEFVGKVENYIKHNNLPGYSLCISCVGKDIYKGREPINTNLKRTIQEKNEKVELKK